MSKDQQIRFSFIENVVGWEGQINATHLATQFKLTRLSASKVLKSYREQYPEYLDYNASTKAFLATAHFDKAVAVNDFSHYLSNIAIKAEEQPNNGYSNVEGSVLEVEAPLRNINPQQVRPILRAIREKKKIDIGYISLSSPDYLDRIIQPHTLIFDGLRWHVRAFCNKNNDFRDFTLSRFNGIAEFEGKADKFAQDDSKWNTFIDVVIEADRRFSAVQKRVIEQDFQMENGQKVITTRAALVNYLLKRLHINDTQNTPEEQQIVLTQASRKAIAPYLPK